MVEARRRNSDLSAEAARLICQRSAIRTNGHYEFRNDPALNWISTIVMTEEQALGCLRKVESPVLSLTARPLPSWTSEHVVAERQAALQHGRHDTLEGHHHFHMDMPGQIAPTIQSFILENDRACAGQEVDEE
jgi:hypothetical protein